MVPISASKRTDIDPDSRSALEVCPSRGKPARPPGPPAGCRPTPAHAG